jgi:hypothetical protein
MSTTSPDLSLIVTGVLRAKAAHRSWRLFPFLSSGRQVHIRADNNRKDKENNFHNIIIEKTIFMCYSISIEKKAKTKNAKRAFGGCAKQEEVTENDNHRRNPKSVFRFFREREKNRGLHTAEQSIH